MSYQLDLTLPWDIYSAPQTPDRYDIPGSDHSIHCEFQDSSASDFIAPYESLAPHTVLAKHYAGELQHYSFFPLQTETSDLPHLQEINSYPPAVLKRKFDHVESDDYFNYRPLQPTPFLHDDTHEHTTTLKPLPKRICAHDIDSCSYDQLDESHSAFDALCSYVTDVEFEFLPTGDYRPQTSEQDSWSIKLEPIETDTEPSSRDEMLKDVTRATTPSVDANADYVDEDLYIQVGDKNIKVTNEELELIRAMMKLEFPDNDPQYRRPKEKGPEPYHVPDTLQQTPQSVSKVYEYGVPFKSLQSREESVILPPRDSYVVNGVSYLGAEPTDTLYDPVFIRRLPSDFDNCGWCEICGKWLQLRNHTYAHHFKSIHGVSQRTKTVVHLPRVIRGEAGDAEKMQGFCERCQTWLDLHHRRDGKRWQTWYIHQFQAHHKEDQRLDALRPQPQLHEKLEKLFDGYLDSP